MKVERAIDALVVHVTTGKEGDEELITDTEHGQRGQRLGERRCVVFFKQETSYEI